MSQTDTLVIFSECGDALAVDIVCEPAGHWRLFFRGVDDLVNLLEDACRYEHLPIESATAVLADADGPLIVYESKRRYKYKRSTTECTGFDGPLPAGSTEISGRQPAVLSHWFYLFGGCAAWVAVFVVLWGLL
jgi:hypothetical protein